MEAGQAPLRSSDAAEGRTPDGKTLASGGLFDSVGGLGVSINGKEAFGDGGFVGLVDTRVVETNVLSVESSFVNRNGIDCDDVEGSEIDQMRLNVGVEEVQEAIGGVLCDFDVVADADPAAGAGVVESEDSRMVEVEDDPEGGNVFLVGDFVWGKIKNHPWWPGQIYDPCDASESAAKHNHKGRFLVAFSDGSFAWCHSSQLKPIEDDFEEMLKQGNSKSFLSAVDNALIDIGKLVELEMTCRCVLKENQGELDRPLAENMGIKEGVLIAERGSNCSITKFEPVEFLANLKNVAQVASVVSMLDLLMVKSRLRAFYRAKGGYKLPEYCEPQQIPGLEDKMEEDLLDTVIQDGAVEVPVQGPFEEEMLSSRGASGYGESSVTCFPNFPGSRENWLHQRKQKSMAEIIAKGGTGSDNSASKSGRKRREATSEADDDSVDSMVSIPKMEGSELSGSFATSGSKISESDGSSSQNGAKKRGRKKKGDCISSVLGGKVVRENGHTRSETKVDAESKEHNEKGYASRVRKKSKYLSPPYTNIIQGEREEDSEAESEQFVSVAQLENRMTKTARQTMKSPIVKCSGEVLHTLSREHGSLNSSKPDPMTIELPVNDVLSEIRSVALHPEEKANDSIVEFLYMHRSSTYHEESHYHAYEQQPDEGTKCASSLKRRGRKRKSSIPEVGLFGKHLNQNGHIVPQSKSLERGMMNNEPTRSNKQKSRRAAMTSDSETKGGSSGPASFFVTFGPGSSLPTQSELIALYKKFGDLVENETDVFYNNFCARVVFVRTSDAEKAFNSSQESSPFGTANVTFRLPNTCTETTTSSPNRRIKTATKSSAGDASQQNCFEEKLEMMTAMVEQSDGKMSPNLR